METLRSALQRVRESFFFLPAAMVIVFVVVGRVAVVLDQQSDGFEGIPLLVSVSIAGGRAITAAVASATITVAAIVFSVTALSTQIASSNYSPRAVGGFFDDRFQQIVIGLVVGTFAYSLSALAGLGGVRPTPQSNPSVSVTLTVVLGVVSALAIVAYIDHSLTRMRVGAVVRRISRQTVDAIRRSRDTTPSDDHPQEVDPGDREKTVVRSAEVGWVRNIAARRLVDRVPPGTAVRIEVRLGEAVSRDDSLATVWVERSETADLVARQVRRAIFAGAERSLQRDPAFGIRQLVDIALRALSPGVNDPTTAVDVIHHLKAPLREILVGDLPRRVFSGPEGRKVYLPEAPSRADHVHGALSEIRLFSEDQPAVLRALLEVIADLVEDLDEADHGGRSAPLVEEARLILAGLETGGLPEPDRARVRGPARRIRALSEGAE